MQSSNKDETYFYCDKNPKLNYIPQFFDLIFVIFHVSNKAYLPKMKHIQSLNLLRWLRNFACLIIQKEIEDVSRNLHFFHKSYLKLLVINSPKFSANFMGIISADKEFEFMCHYRYRPIRKKAYQSPTSSNPFEIFYLHSSNLMENFRGFLYI